MRVALFTETFLPKIDGIVKVACITLEHFQRRGIEAVVVAPHTGVREYAGARVISIPSTPNPFYPESWLSFANPVTYYQVRRFRR